MTDLDDMIREAARLAIRALTPDDFLGTVEVGELAWDVYVHPMPAGSLRRLRPRSGIRFDDAITVAVRLTEDGDAEVGCFIPGRLTLAEASRALHMRRRH